MTQGFDFILLMTLIGQMTRFNVCRGGLKALQTAVEAH